MERYSVEEFSPLSWLEDLFIFVIVLGSMCLFAYGVIKLANRFGFLLGVL